MAHPGGRPRLYINWDEVDKLCMMHCTKVEVALWFGVSEDTIERACKREKKVRFAEYYEQKRTLGKAAIRRVQFQKALGGSIPMLIWWGKNNLGQSDKSEDILRQYAEPIIVELSDGRKEFIGNKKDIPNVQDTKRPA